MKEYVVCFEIYGKKMKAKVYAENEQKAKVAVLSKVNFHKIYCEKNIYNDTVDVMDDMANFLKGFRK